MARLPIATDEEIMAMIVEMDGNGETLDIMEIRRRVNGGSPNRISEQVKIYRAEKADQPLTIVPDMPDDVQKTLARAWTTSYQMAEALLENRRTAFETERSAHERDRMAMMDEITRLDEVEKTLTEQIEERDGRSAALREELEQVRRDLAAAQAAMAELRTAEAHLREEKQRVEETLREQGAVWNEQRTALETAKAAAEAKAEQLTLDLEVAKQTANGQATTMEEIRTSLETEREARVTAEAQQTALSQQLDTLRSERDQAVANAQELMERATTAEAQLQAIQTAAPKK